MSESIASLLRQNDRALFSAHELAFQAQTARLNALLGIEKSQELALDLTRNEIALARYAQSSAVTLMELSRPQDEDEGNVGRSFSPLQVEQALSPSSSAAAPVAEDLAATLAKNAARSKCVVSTCARACIDGDVICREHAHLARGRSEVASEPAPVAGDLVAALAKRACEDRARQRREPNQNAQTIRRPAPLPGP